MMLMARKLFERCKLQQQPESSKFDAREQALAEIGTSSRS
jgi:hypothetical protein